MTPLEKRIELLERKVAQQDREIVLLRKEVRPAMPLAPRHGRFFAITRSTLTPGGSCDVDVVIRTGNQWRRIGVVIEDCLDYYLNAADENVLAPTKCEVAWYENCWVIAVLYCDVSDWEEATPQESLAPPLEPLALTPPANYFPNLIPQGPMQWQV